MNKNYLKRSVPIDLSADDFRKIGYNLVDKIADYMENIASMPVTGAEDEETIQSHLNSNRILPDKGSDPEKLIDESIKLLLNHSLFNGHPRFWGYITSSAAPLGVLGDFLSSAINSNVGAWTLSPIASEIEAQTVRWIGSLIGYPSNGGLIVSGGAVANYIGFIAAIRAKTHLDLRKKGINFSKDPLIVYCSEETHTWIQKAADLFGLGTDSIRWIKADLLQKMDIDALKKQIEIDLASGYKPFLIVGTAGSVSTGAIDPLAQIADLCKHYNLWFHIDGAYGGFAASVPELATDFTGLERADSIAVDPHKWLYAPLEAGCILVKDASHLTDAFSYHPPYYNFEKAAVNYVDYGIQNSRGFKALKVWLLLQQIGSQGYEQLIREDIRLTEYAFNVLSGSQYIEVFTKNLSIATFRYVPPDLRNSMDSHTVKEYLDDLNREILDKIEKSGKFFVSNAFISDIFLLRMCIVNFRTQKEDIDAFASFLADKGHEIDQKIRQQNLR